MQAEIEAKFLDVNADDVRARLKEAGAALEYPMRPMRRVLIEEDHHIAERSFIRIRDEGDKVTVAFKRKEAKRGEDTATSTYEIETTVGDFDTAVKLFAEAGWKYRSYQESRRELWHCDDVEVTIDEWPWIMPYVEIEGKSEDVVRQVATKLGFEWGEAVFSSVNSIYRRDFPRMTVRGISGLKEVRFNGPIPMDGYIIHIIVFCIQFYQTGIILYGPESQAYYITQQQAPTNNPDPIPDKYLSDLGVFCAQSF